jgi:hypothetical protein
MRCLLPILAATCWAGEVEAVRIQLGPASTLAAHWSESVLDQLLTDASLVPLRTRCLAWLESYGAASPRGPNALQAVLSGLDGKGQPRWAVQSDLGTRAPLSARRIVAGCRLPRPIAVPAADEAWQLDGMVLARFGGIVAYGRPVEQLPIAPIPSSADIAVEVGIPILLQIISGSMEGRHPAIDGLFNLMGTRWRELSVRADLTTTGSSWRGMLRGDASGLKAVDRSMLAKLPKSTVAALLIGIDGPQLWQASGSALSTVLDGSMQGLPDLRSVVEACDGTVAILLTAGVPYPGISVVLPRHVVLDDLVATLCARSGAQPPAEGGNTFIVVPDLPVPLMLAKNADFWLLTSDAELAAFWGTAAAGGLDHTVTGATLLQRAPSEACILVACDSGAAVRSLMGQINQALALGRELDQTERHALLSGAAKLSTVLTPACQWAVMIPDGLELAGEGGDLTWIAIPALAAAWTIPTWIDNGAGASANAAITTLKSKLFPAEVQFQAGAYVDQDADGTGEYGLLSELAGRRPTGKEKDGPICLLQDPLTTGDISNGYRFAVYLPDGTGGAVGEPDGLLQRPSIVGAGKLPDADEQESRFVIYAWPADGEAGLRMFALDQNGQVHESIWDGQAPSWNSLYNGGSWTDEPAWPVVKRGARRR